MVLGFKPLIATETAFDALPLTVPAAAVVPYAVVVPYWKLTVVRSLFGLTVALSVAAVDPIDVAGPVVAVGAAALAVPATTSDIPTMATTGITLNIRMTPPLLALHQPQP